MTGRKFFQLLWNARSLDEMELAQAAHRKWSAIHQGTSKQFEGFEASGTMIGLREDAMRQAEAEGKSSRQWAQESQAKFYEKIGVLAREVMTEQECNEFWQQILKEDQEHKIMVDALVVEIRAFVG